MERSSKNLLEKDVSINSNLLEIHENHNNNLQNTDKIEQNKKFEIPKSLKKTFYLSLSLFIIGTILIIVGIIKITISESFTEGLPYWILAFVILIPGSFYQYQFIKAKYTKDMDLRRELLSEIPEL